MNKAKRLIRAKQKRQARIYRKAYKTEDPKEDFTTKLFAGLRSRSKRRFKFFGNKSK